MLFLRLSVILIVFLCILPFQPLPHKSIANRAGSSIDEAPPDFPPGATVLFPLNSNNDTQTHDVFIKRIDSQADQMVWTVPLQRPVQTTIGFVVPQLARGTYEAWYEPRNTSVKIQSVKFTIAPRLIAEEGIVRSEPGKEVEVKVRIPIPKVDRKGGGSTEVNVSVRLISHDPEIAQIIGDGPQKIDRDGSAVWKVRIIGAGVAEVEATADDFEPAIMNVVGMPGPGSTFLEAQIASLKTQMRGLQRSADIAEERARTVQAEIESRQRKTTATLPEKATAEIESLKARRVAAAAAAEKYETLSNNTRTLLEEFSALQPPSIKERELKHGDVLLVFGSSPIISGAIRHFDGQQLGARGEYSHASLYVGEINGIRMVAEMWSSGYWITPLNVSTKDARLVDVYRHVGIDDSKRNEIAKRGKNIFGNPLNFVRNKSPWFFSFGSGLPYAHEEIKVLGLSALGLSAERIQNYIVTKVDPSAGGRRKMICSELVAWVYEDVGLPLEVQYWRALTDAGIFSSNDRRRDYTTPNMIALSRNLARVGRYLGP